jgi:hypothetical protein
MSSGIDGDETRVVALRRTKPLPTMTKQYIVAAIVELAAERLQRLEHIRTSMLATIQAEREQIIESHKDSEVTEDMLADEYPFLQDAEEMIGGLLVVGLYSAVEHFSKQLLRHRYPPNKVKQLYKIETLREALEKDCGMNLFEIPEFVAIDDLRKRNNAVKHGEPYREPSLELYDRVRPAVIPYLERIGFVILLSSPVLHRLELGQIEVGESQSEA